MKKYCLTKCFKKKMSDGAKKFLALIIVIAILFGIILASVAVAYVIGVTLIHFFDFKDNPINLGTLTIVLLAFGGWVLHLLFLGGRALYKKTYEFAIARYEGEPYQCNIFEECADEA